MVNIPKEEFKHLKEGEPDQKKDEDESPEKVDQTKIVNVDRKKVNFFFFNF